MFACLYIFFIIIHVACVDFFAMGVWCPLRAVVGLGMAGKQFPSHAGRGKWQIAPPPPLSVPLDLIKFFGTKSWPWKHPPPPCARWPGALGSWLAGHCLWVLVWTGACYLSPLRAEKKFLRFWLI